MKENNAKKNVMTVACSFNVFKYYFEHFLLDIDPSLVRHFS